MTSTVLAQSNGGSPVGTLLFFLVMGLLFYAFAVLPNRRRMRAMQQVQAGLAPGREVLTASGLYGRVVAADAGSDVVTLEVAPGVDVRVARGAVVRLVDAPAVADEAAVEPS